MDSLSIVGPGFHPAQGEFRFKRASCQKPVPAPFLRNCRHRGRCGSDRGHASSASRSRQRWRIPIDTGGPQPERLPGCSASGPPDQPRGRSFKLTDYQERPSRRSGCLLPGHLSRERGRFESAAHPTIPAARPRYRCHAAPVEIAGASDRVSPVLWRRRQELHVLLDPRISGTTARNRIRLSPYSRRLSQLHHERSCAGKWAALTCSFSAKQAGRPQ